MSDLVLSDHLGGRHEFASVVIQLSLALEQTSELLETATNLHRQLAELHAGLTEPLVDLERLLTEERKRDL